jgi:uncharacterized protein (TIGR03000 family)
MTRLFAPVLICFLLPGIGSAQVVQDIPPYPDPYGGGTIIRGPRCDVGVFAGPGFGPGYWPTYGRGYWHHSGWPYGPRVAPPWGYYGLAGGPFVTYPWGFPGYSARAGSSWSNGLSLYGPPVPTYGPIPGVFGANDLNRLWRDVPSPGIPFGWIGIYAASPRHRPLTVNVWPRAESVPLAAPPIADPAKVGGCLILSVKVPQPAAEVFVDGVKTVQTGTDRVFESPPLEAGKAFRYQVTARWVERGAVRESKRTVTGTPGEVVRVDFTAPEVVVTGK